jgi:uncharacterized repeat protein (TIGR01451 family)
MSITRPTTFVGGDRAERFTPAEGFTGGGFAESTGDSAPTFVATTTLTLGLTDSADPTPAGANFDYTAQVTNTGAISATSLTVTITLDASVTYVSSSGVGWSLSQLGQVVTATLATLAVGAANPIVVTVTAGNSNASISTNGSVAASNASTVNTSQGTTVVRPTTSVTLTDAADPVVGGNNVVYSSTFTNSGAGTVNGITATFTLDASLTYVSSSGVGWSLSQSGQTVTATLASLGVSAANAISITATSTNSTASISSSVAVTATNAATANASQATQINAVSKDATSGIYVPASSTEMTNLGLFAAANTLWLSQEASGNLADSIGALTLTANATPGYQAAITGWTRKGVALTDGTANQRFGATTGVGPDPSTTSSAWLVYVKLTTATPAATRGVLGLASNVSVQHTSGADQIKIVCVGVTTAGATTYTDGSVHPLLLVYDRTNSRVKAYTDKEVITGTYGAGATDGNKGFGTGGSVSTPAGGNVLYGALWTGANAESLSTSATAKTLLQTLGWTIPW